MEHGKSQEAYVALEQDDTMVRQDGQISSKLQVAMKNNQQEVVYFDDILSFEALLVENGRIDSHTFVSTWKGIPEIDEVTTSLQSIIDRDSIKFRLENQNIFVLAEKQIGEELIFYATGCVLVGQTRSQLLAEIRCKSGGLVEVYTRSERQAILPLFIGVIEKCFRV